MRSGERCVGCDDGEMSRLLSRDRSCILATLYKTIQNRETIVEHYYFTEKGFQKIKEEIDKLEKYIKQDIAKEIGTAREHGDIKENAEYHAAKDKQANYMAKLGQLQERFSRARIVRKEELAPDIVTLGKRVEIRDVDADELKVYTILGEGETDISKGIISYQSPLAKALLSHKKGDLVEVQLPRGMKKFEILSIKFFEDD